MDNYDYNDDFDGIESPYGRDNAVQPLDWNNAVDKSKILAVTRGAGPAESQSRVYNPYTDQQGSYHPQMEVTDLPLQKTINPSLQPLDDIETKLSKLVAQQGAFRSLPEYNAALVSKLREVAQERGYDIDNDPQYQDWYRQNIQQGLKEAPRFFQPRSKDSVLQLEDGSVLDLASGGLIHDPYADLRSGAKSNPGMGMSAYIERARNDPRFASTKMGQAALKEADRMQKETQEDQPLDDDAVDVLARQYVKSGILPPMGMGKTGAANRNKILNAASSLIKNSGSSVDDALANQQSFKADAGELKKLQSQRGQIMAFEKTAEKNIDQVRQLSSQLDRTQFPIINQALQTGRTQIAGNPTASKYALAVKTLADEYTKVLVGSGMSSDSARQKTEALLNTAQSVEQMSGVLDQMHIEMQNRGAGYDDQINSIKQSMSGKKGESNGQESPPSYDPKTQKLQHRVVNGKTEYRVVPK